MTAWINDVYNKDIKMQKGQRSILVSLVQVWEENSFILTRHCPRKKARVAALVIFTHI